MTKGLDQKSGTPRIPFEKNMCHFCLVVLKDHRTYFLFLKQMFHFFPGDLRDLGSKWRIISCAHHPSRRSLWAKLGVPVRNKLTYDTQEIPFPQTLLPFFVNVLPFFGGPFCFPRTRQKKIYIYIYLLGS